MQFSAYFVVDYPNETKEDLELLEKFLSDVPFLQGGVFAYFSRIKRLKDNIYDEFDWKKSKKLMFAWEVNFIKLWNQLLEKIVGTIQRL
jgi:tRNA A37 methylthiotransferase MiaB